MDDEGLPMVKTEEDYESDGLSEGCMRQELMNSSIEATMHNKNEEAHQSMERKRKEPSEEFAETDDPESPDQAVHKKQRFIWSTDVHNQFLDAVTELGFNKAVPTKILALMKVEGLTRENVASHLQKYRLHVRKRHQEMYKGCALPDEGRENHRSVTSGIRNSRRSLVLPDPLAMQARGEYTCFVPPQSVASLSNQFSVYPTIQGILHTPFTDMLSEKGVQVISSGVLEHGFYDNYCPYESDGLAFSGPLPPDPLVDSYGNSFLPELGNLSVADQRVTSPSLNQNMENFGGVIHSPRKHGGVVHSSRHGGLDGGVVHSPGHCGLDGGLVHSPFHGGLDGGVVHSPRHGRLDGGLMDLPRQGRFDGGIVHPPRQGGLDGGVVQLPRPGERDGVVHLPRQGGLDGGVVPSPRHGELDGGLVHLPRRGGLRGELLHSPRRGRLHGGDVRCMIGPRGSAHSPVEAPGFGGRGTVHSPVEVPGHGWGAMECPVEVPGLAGGGATCQVDAPGLAPKHHLEDRNGDSNAHQPISDAEEAFFSLESPSNWANFIQDLEDTGIDDLFR